MNRCSLVVLALVCAVFSFACTPAAPASRSSDGGGAAEGAQQPKNLVAAIRIEPAFIAPKPLRQAGLTLGSTVRLFGASLAMSDAQGLTGPYLAETLPELNTESWKVFPDGRMETTYRLKPNLAWHDGTALAPEDFAFALKVYTEPDFGLAASAPQSLVDEILIPDPRAVVIRWKRPYPFASALEATGQRNLPPLPRHLLEEPFGQLSAEAFAALPYWTTEYVGLGPYKVERWEPGAFIEASAFHAHALVDRRSTGYDSSSSAMPTRRSRISCRAMSSCSPTMRSTSSRPRS